MTSILYPTRGGPSSYPNQDKVIQIAQERGARLVFLYVANVDFLDSLRHSSAVDLAETELEEMGEFLLAMAQERATKAGWEAEAIVKNGNFVAAVKEVIEAEQMTTVVLGTPGGRHAMTTEPYLEELKRTLEEELGIDVILLSNPVDSD